MRALFYSTLVSTNAEARYFEKTVLMESIAYDIYEPVYAADNMKDTYRQLIESICEA
jgi:hypothetical protein